MALSVGIRLGPYEILSALGAGGMGEVYRARDTKLGRDIALKILPTTFTNDPDRVARFRREAQVLASLNHPHIAQIHGLDDANGTQFLVLELVDGESLDKRIARGPIPVDEALGIAKQIAEALEAAHERGIIHRDLKPANIALTKDGQVKILDFGLAKAVETTGSVDAMNSPTITSPALMTGVGVILGTAAYMSPEQAKGRPADKRSDIWAFGCVLLEMLTGRRAFDGEDVSDTLAAVLRAEPDWKSLPEGTPVRIRTVLRRCLQREPQRRLRDMGDASLEIGDGLTVAAENEVTLPETNGVPRRRALILAGSALAAGACLSMTVAWIAMKTSRTSSAALQPMRFAIVPPATQPLQLLIDNPDRNIVLSPDGSHLIYVAGPVGGGGQLMVQDLRQLDATPLPGIDNARAPFMSPDGHWVGFFVGGELRKVSITGGPAISICAIRGGPRGASWGANDTIIFGTSEPNTGLFAVSAAGGEPKVLTKPDAAHGETSHVFPSILPDGQAVLFTITSGGLIGNAQIAVLNLRTGERKILIRGGSAAEYVETGHLVYAAAGTLRAVGFDPVRFETRADSAPVVERVRNSFSGAGNFSISQRGVLTYIPGSGLVAANSLVWVDRGGHEEAIDAPPRNYIAPRISPDGTRVALEVVDLDQAIWIYDLVHRSLTRLTFSPSVNANPVWTPDGRRIMFNSSRAGGSEVFLQPADGTGRVEQLTSIQSSLFSYSISPDGTRLVVGEISRETGQDLAVLHLTADRRIEHLIQAPLAQLNAEISPDGRWLAYQSNESGQFQIYVRPFPNVETGRWQISTGVGTRPAWARSGHELFYLDGNGLLTSVPVRTTPTFSAGQASRVFETRYYTGPPVRPYDVSPDGHKFLMIKTAATESSGSARIVVVLNWSEELKQRVPTK